MDCNSNLSKNKIRFIEVAVLVALAVFFVYSVQASSNVCAWSSGLGIGLNGYNSVIDASDTMFFSQLSWNQNNATVANLHNVWMGTGTAINILTVSSDVNMTFSQLSNSELTYTVPGSGNQNFTGISEPLAVKIDGVLVDSGWTYSSNTLHVDGASSSVDVTFQGSGLTVEDAVGIAMIFSIISIAVSVGLIYVKKKGND